MIVMISFHRKCPGTSAGLAGSHSNWSCSSHVSVLFPQMMKSGLGLGLDKCCLEVPVKLGKIVSVPSQTNHSGGQWCFHPAFMAKEQSLTFFPILREVIQCHLFHFLGEQVQNHQIHGARRFPLSPGKIWMIFLDHP